MCKFSIVASLFPGPDSLHGFNSVDHAPTPVFIPGAVVLQFVLVPSGAYAKLKPPFGNQIQAGAGFRRHDWVTLAYQSDSSTDTQRPGHDSGRRQVDERIQGVGIFPG